MHIVGNWSPKNEIECPKQAHRDAPKMNKSADKWNWLLRFLIWMPEFTCERPLCEFECTFMFLNEKVWN